MVVLAISNGQLVKQSSKLSLCCCGGGATPPAPCIVPEVTTVYDLSCEIEGFVDWADNGCVPACFDCDALLNGTHVLSATADLSDLSMYNSAGNARPEWRGILDPFIWFKSLGQKVGHWYPATTGPCQPGTFCCTDPVCQPVTWEVFIIAYLGHHDNIYSDPTGNPVYYNQVLQGPCALTIEVLFYSVDSYRGQSLPVEQSTAQYYESFQLRNNFYSGAVNPNLWSNLVVTTGGASVVNVVVRSCTTSLPAYYTATISAIVP